MSGSLLRLAWRNLWYNPGRTLIAMAAIGFGYAMLLFVACLMAGLRQQMIASGTDLALSDIEVHAPGYYPDRPLQQTLGGRNGTDVGALVAAIEADPTVRAAGPRVYGFGLVSAAHQSVGAQLLGVDPELERKLTVLQTRMIKGHYLTDDMPKGVVMGDQLATAIGVDVGADIVLLASAADGSMGNDLYTLAGTFHTGLDEMDRGLVLMPLAALQDLLRLPPGRIHEVGIKLRDIGTAAATAAALEAQLDKTIPVRVQPWQELAPELSDYVQFNGRVTFMLFFIFFLLAAMGIINTMLMAIIERTRELGMLMAVGMRPVQVVGLIMAEAVSLAAASLVLGAALGAPLLWYLQVHGLSLGARGGAVSLAGVVVGPLWHGRQDFPAYVQAALGLAVTALASALYPALRAARFQPAEALRKV
jgi:ABC-type lipoprotein release transport system permease subunit